VALHGPPSAGRGEFSEKAGASAVLHFLGKLLHGLLRDHAAFSAGEGSSGVVERHKESGPLPLAFLTPNKGLLQGVAEFRSLHPPRDAALFDHPCEPVERSLLRCDGDDFDIEFDTVFLDGGSQPPSGPAGVAGAGECLS